MSVTLETAVAALKASALADPSAHLKPGGRVEITDELARWKSRGLTAHVLVVDPRDSLATLLTAFDALGLDARTDLLLVFDTRAWLARGWGLTPAAIASALETAHPTRKATFAQLIVGALAALGTLAAAGTAGTASRETAASLPIVPLVGGIGVVAGLVAFVVMRRNKRAREGLATFGVAKASAESAYTEVILACEELAAIPEATEIQLRAAELKRRMDTVVAEVEAAPVTAGDRVAIGRIEQLQNELVALRSTVLQKAKG